MVASCKGVVRTKPWPIAVITVSPPCQRSPTAPSFQARVGIRPARSFGRSIPFGLPMPKRTAMSAMRSIPSCLATL